MNSAPNFSDLNAIEENLLQAKLDAVRAAIVQAPENGRALEHGVRTLLRSILPAEYGLTQAPPWDIEQSSRLPRLKTDEDNLLLMS